MAYTKQDWVNGDATKPVSATRLNHIEDGIEAAHELAEGGSVDLATQTELDAVNTALDARLDTLEARVPAADMATQAELNSAVALKPNLYVQDTQPSGAPVGSLWAETSGGVVVGLHVLVA